MRPDAEDSARRKKYSILIPTRNGARYLPYAIDSVLSQTSQDFELIVSDNHSTDGTAAYLDGLDDPRLVKLRPPTALPMTSHFEYIVEHARGDWVTIIGDDDALMPFFFECVDALNLDAFNVDSVGFRRAYYFWDGCEELYGERVVSYSPANTREVAGNAATLFHALCLGSSYMDMPQLYTGGLVRNAFIRAIKRKSGGAFFHARSPDAASAAIVAVNARRHLRVEQPVFWTGTSPKSVGFSHSSTGQKTRVNEFQSQNSAGGIRSSARIPPSLLQNTNLTVELYDSLLLTPGVGRFWTSGFVECCVVAGLLRRGGSVRQDALAAYRDRLSGLKLAPFRVFVALAATVAKTYLRHTSVRRAKRNASPGLTSNDRSQFPTIREASAAVDRLYRAAAARGSKVV